MGSFKGRSKRSDLEIVFDLLNALRQNPGESLCRISTVANVTYTVMKLRLDFLLEKNLVECYKTKSTRNCRVIEGCRLTSLGYDWLHKAQEMVKIIS